MGKKAKALATADELADLKDRKLEFSTDTITYEPYGQLAIARVLGSRRETRQLRREFDRDGFLQRASHARAYSLFVDAETAGESKAAEGEQEEGRVIRFLNWILAHQDQIIAFVKLISGLFAKAGV